MLKAILTSNSISFHIKRQQVHQSNPKCEIIYIAKFTRVLSIYRRVFSVVGCRGECRCQAAVWEIDRLSAFNQTLFLHPFLHSTYRSIPPSYQHCKQSGQSAVGRLRHYLEPAHLRNLVVGTLTKLALTSRPAAFRSPAPPLTLLPRHLDPQS